MSCCNWTLVVTAGVLLVWGLRAARREVAAHARADVAFKAEIDRQAAERRAGGKTGPADP